MSDFLATALRLYGDGSFGEALDCLADTVFLSVLADPPRLDHTIRDLLEECGPAYLVGLAEELDVTLGRDESVERWIRNLQKALPRECGPTVPSRLTMVAISYMFDVLAHEAEIGEDYRAVLADASVFVAWRLVLAERHQEAFEFVPKAESWVGDVIQAEAHDLAVAALRLCRARLVSAYELGLAEDGLMAFDKAEAVGRDHPRAWSIFSAEFLTRQARHLAGRGNGAEALALADRAVVESAPGDLMDARMVRLDLRAIILGVRRDYSDAMEGLAPGGRAAVAEVEGLIRRLEAGHGVAPGELPRIAERLALFHDALTLDPERARATLDLRAKLALSTGNRALALELRPELAARTRESGRTGLEATALSIAIDGLVSGSIPTEAVADLLHEAITRVSGFEALLTNRVLFKLAAEAPSGPVWQALAAWFHHLALSLAEETRWEGRLQLLDSSRWWFPELEMAVYGVVALADMEEGEAAASLLRLAVAMFSAGHAPAIRTDRALREAARRLVRTEGGRLLFDRLAEVVASGGDDDITATKETLLASLYGAEDIARQAAGCDAARQPQLLYVETRAFLPGPAPEIAVVDTLSGQPRRLMLDETEPLRDLVESVFDHSRLRFDKGRAAVLGTMLIPYSFHHLPTVFGIRGSGLIQAVPFAALPTQDGTPLGHVSVPVLLTGPDSRLDSVTRPFTPDGRRVLIVADPDYAGADADIPLAEGEVVHPATGERMALDAFWTQAEQATEGRGRGVAASLPGSRIEALTTAGLMAGRMDVDVLTGPRACRAEVLARLWMEPPSVLHLAVHGTGAVENPSSAHLKLSKGGLIAFDEIALLDLSAVDLVILSACSTMHGGIRRGEGILALAWAFRAAGAKAVISTRWAVDDLASPFVWRAFYGHLLDGGDICSSLLAAQAALRSSPHFNTPRHWAAYQLIV